jgi:hypothetical protein
VIKNVIKNVIQKREDQKREDQKREDQKREDQKRGPYLLEYPTNESCVVNKQLSAAPVMANVKRFPSASKKSNRHVNAIAFRLMNVTLKKQRNKRTQLKSTRENIFHSFPSVDS